MKPFQAANLQFALKNRRILLGISGSIAAFKACDIIRHLRACGAEVRVVLTESAQKFVTQTTLETLSGNPVSQSLWNDGHGTHHIDVARWAEVALIAPASANTIAKMALGLGSDVLSTELLAFRGPLLVAPAMNPAMFSHPAVQSNLSLLKSRGAKIIGPDVGATACGELGEGRMIEPDQIVEHVAESFVELPRKKHLLITLGPTRSALDPVRYITNRSSGLMGASLAWAAALRGYNVTAIAGPISESVCLPRSANVIQVDTAEKMFDAAKAHFSKCDIFISAAAVLDWDVVNPAPQKLKKESNIPLSIEFKKNPDILAELSKLKRADQFVLGFAAETEEPLLAAQRKLSLKNCDAIFANDVSRPDQGFESQSNAGWWITTHHTSEIHSVPKPDLAHILIDSIELAVRSSGA